MYAKLLKKRGGFTFIEMAAAMTLASFALGGFMLLWAGVAKQEDKSMTERTIDAYGNFLMYRINQDLKNAFTYDLFRSGNLYGISMQTVDYTSRIPDTLRIRWQVLQNGDAVRSLQMNNSTRVERMFREFFGPNTPVFIHNQRGNQQMYCTKFKLFPMHSNANDYQSDYSLLDSAGVQMDLSLKYVNSHPQTTVNEGNQANLPTVYVRQFDWTTMVYLRNFYITRYNAGNASLF